DAPMTSGLRCHRPVDLQRKSSCSSSTPKKGAGCYFDQQHVGVVLVLAGAASGAGRASCVLPPPAIGFAAPQNAGAAWESPFVNRAGECSGPCEARPST